MTDTASTKLAACPFCNEVEELALHSRREDEGRYLWAVCYTCAAEGPKRTTAEKAIAAWNQRPTPPSQDKGEALAEELERRATFGGEIGTFQCPPELTARILAALKTRTSPETVELLRETRGTMAEQVRRCERWGKSHHEMDAAISAIDAHLSNTPGKEGSDG